MAAYIFFLTFISFLYIIVVPFCAQFVCNFICNGLATRVMMSAVCAHLCVHNFYLHFFEERSYSKAFVE